MYLNSEQVAHLTELLKTFFRIPYSTDLSGKDAETLIRLVKGNTGRQSRRKELFDIVDGATGYSVKTLRKGASATRVDLQEQRFCDVEEVRRLRQLADRDPKREGDLLLAYMDARVRAQMTQYAVTTATSLILLKDWNKARTEFVFRYWEEDLLCYVEGLKQRNAVGKIEWIAQGAGLHGRDCDRQDEHGRNVRLIRMHYKHNQIFTDHDIPGDALVLRFRVSPLSWKELAELLAHPASH